MSTIVPASSFIPLESIKLGRFLANISDPHQGYHDPQCAQPPKSIPVSLNSFTGLNHNQTSRDFGSFLTSVIAAGFTKRAQVGVKITAEHVKAYSLDNSNEWFEEAVGIPATRTWIERAVSRGDQVYIVVGFHTVTNARIVQESTQGGKVGGQIKIPVSLSLSAAGAIVPLADLDPGIGGTRQDLDSVQSHFVAPGELVCALQYRKVRHKWFSSKTVDLSRLSTARWVTVAGERGYEEEEDDEDGIEVSLGEAVVFDA